MPDSELEASNDLLSRRFTPWLVYGLPSLVLYATSVFDSPRSIMTVVWPLAFLVMGIACLLNALKCRRVHCWFTGPLFLALGVGSLLHGLGILPLGPEGWTRMWWTFGIGTAILYFVPEWIWGRYFRRP